MSLIVYIDPSSVGSLRLFFLKVDQNPPVFEVVGVCSNPPSFLLILPFNLLVSTYCMVLRTMWFNAHEFLLGKSYGSFSSCIMSIHLLVDSFRSHFVKCSLDVDD